jgi:hypothetical protein
MKPVLCISKNGLLEGLRREGMGGCDSFQNRNRREKL